MISSLSKMSVSSLKAAIVIGEININAVKPEFVADLAARIKALRSELAKRSMR
jgi:hypothetical protein